MSEVAVFSKSFNLINHYINIYTLNEYREELKMKYMLSLTFLKMLDSDYTLDDLQSLSLEEFRDIVFEYMWLKYYLIDLEYQDIATLFLIAIISFGAGVYVAIVKEIINTYGKAYSLNSYSCNSFEDMVKAINIIHNSKHILQEMLVF